MIVCLCDYHRVSNRTFSIFFSTTRLIKLELEKEMGREL